MSTPLVPRLVELRTVQELSQLKNRLIGKREAKLELLRSGDVSGIAQLVQSASELSDNSYKVAIQAAAILGALSLPTPEAIAILIAADAHRALLAGLAHLSHPASLDGGPHLALRCKLLETLLRSLKTLYVDVVKVVGPRAWGCSVIGASVKAEERQDVRQLWESDPARGKGKQRESGDMEGVEHAGAAAAGHNLGTLADAALRAVYHVRELPETASSSAGPSGEATVAPAPVLGFLLQLLRDCSQKGGVWAAGTPLTSDSNRFRLADMICTFISGTVRLPYQRAAVLADPEVITEALLGLVEHGNGKVQEAALQALSALARDNRQMSILINTAGSENGRLVDLVTELTLSPIPSLRLAATTCQCILYKTLVDGKEPADSLVGMAEPLVPILLGLMEKETMLRAQSSFIFAYLVADNEGLQDIAVKLKCLPMLKEALHAPPRVEQPYATPASTEESACVQEGALLALAVLTAKVEATRHRVLAAGLVPSAVDFLSHESSGVRAAACHVLRGLGRSVHVLRTSLVDSGAAGPISDLLREDEDPVVQITAAAAISNLVLEFSPMRDTLIEHGCIRRLCELARSPNRTLKINALFALKNATYQSRADWKRATVVDLGWPFLAECIADVDDEVCVEALSILRNVTCTVNDDPICGLREMGEERMLSLLENGLVSKSTKVVMQVVYILVNVATADESAKLAIVARIKLLQALMSHFDHPNSEVRVAAVWVMINLAFQDRGPHERRKPYEIVARLRALGVEHKLRGMSGDLSLDVRERVRDALETLASAGCGISGY